MNFRLAQIAEAMRVGGVAIGVVMGDRTVYVDGLGWRDVKAKRPVTPDSVFYIASCTQPFVATAVISLADDGKIDLDQPVKRYLPTFRIADAELTSSLTIRDLLAYAKGLDSEPIDWLADYTGELTTKRFDRWLHKVAPTIRPARSSLNYLLIGRVIEAVTGRSWQSVVTERVLKPAGLAHTTCYAGKLYAHDNAALPAVRVEDGFAMARVRKTDRTMNAAGGIGSNVRDLARFLRFQMNGGALGDKRIVSQRGVLAMQTQQTAAGRRWVSPVPRTREGFGLGWSIGTYRGVRLLSASGSFPGASAHLSIMPDKRIGVAVLTNTDGAATELAAMEVYDRLLGEKGEDLLPRFQGILEQRLQRVKERRDGFKALADLASHLTGKPTAYTGEFVNDDWGTLRITDQQGKPLGRLGTLELQFRATGTDRFLIDDGTGRFNTGRFEAAPDGRITGAVIDLLDGRQHVRFVRR